MFSGELMLAGGAGDSGRGVEVLEAGSTVLGRNGAGWGRVGRFLAYLHSDLSLVTRPEGKGPAIVANGVRPMRQGARPARQKVRPATHGARPLTQKARPATLGVRPMAQKVRPMARGATGFSRKLPVFVKKRSFFRKTTPD